MTQELLLIAIGSGVGVTGYFVKKLLDKVEALTESIGELEKELASIKVLCHERHMGPWAHHRAGDPS